MWQPLLLACVGIVWLLPVAAVSAPRKLLAVAEEVDREIGQRLTREKVPPSPVAEDAEFLRRVYLDITGRIPTGEKAAAFLDSKDRDKRRKLIDELLASPHHGEHLGNIWHNLIAPTQLKALLNEQPVESEPLARWLAEQFNRGRGWDAIVTDFLTSEGAPPEAPQMYFVLVNGDARGHPQPSNLARNTAKLFLGIRQLECAECHDHPFADWKQTDFWGLAAFFSRLEKPFARHRAPIAEVTGTKNKGGLGAASKISADAQTNVGKVVKAKLLNGPEPTLDLNKPIRPALAAWVTAPESPYFATAAVNRMWAHFFGRGLIDPVDGLGEDNAPSHPELLKLLSAEFTASGFDLKHLIRCVCNSRAYQRTSQPLPANKEDKRLFSRMSIKVLRPEMLLDSLRVALETPDLFPATKMPQKKGLPVVLNPREQFLQQFSTQEEDGDPTEFTQGIAQALSRMNHEPLQSGKAVIDRLMKADSRPEKVVEGLYLATLSRRPGAEELKLAVAHVARKAKPADGYRGVMWSLLNRSEFILNH
jgi:hypothetical protein